MTPSFELFQNPGSDTVRPDQVGELVLRVLKEERRNEDFLTRRAHHAVESLPSGPERRHLHRVLRDVDAGREPSDRLPALVAWAGHLESRGLLDWASEVLRRARRLRPRDPALVIHEARVARKAGDVERARACYDRVAELDDGSGCLARMAEVGYALLVEDSGEALGRAMRRMVRAGDPEAAAVAQEARARLRRSQGEVEGALRDYAGAAVRYGDPVDVGRIGHEAADLLNAVGDPLAARRVLLATERLAHPAQAARARSRLLTLSRALDDQLGIRRWAEASPPALVSLVPRKPAEPGRSHEARVDRLIRRIAGD